MRITKGMLNLTRRRAGMQTNQPRGNSLLNYVGKKGVAGARLSAMNATNIRAARMEQSNCDKLGKTSNGLLSALSSMTKKVDAGNGSIDSEVSQMIDKYNVTLKTLKDATGVLNQFYLQSMREISSTNRKELEAIGITAALDGSLSLDKEKLAAADKEKVRKLLGTDAAFAQRAGYIASRVADNAEANAASVSSRYNSKGSIASSYLNKYNFWG